MISERNSQGEEPAMRKITVSLLPGLLAAATALTLASGAACAQTIPAQYASQNRDMRFLVMQMAPGSKCAVGVVRLTAHGGPGGCSVSINECFSVHGTVGKNWRGDAACVEP
jgi:hypothetical protein